MKVLLINGSPRKNWNTHKLLTEAEHGAKDAGAETVFYNLYDLNFTGCRSCFACKVKDAKTHGACSWPDDLKPVMQELISADAVILGSPVYLGNLSAQTNLFWERLMFCNLSYSSYDRSKRIEKDIRAAMILTMGCPEELMGRMGYKQQFDYMGQQFGYTLGNAPAKMLYCCDTYQFTDYSKINISPDRADPVKKAAHREKQFPVDLERAYELGKTMAR